MSIFDRVAKRLLSANGRVLSHKAGSDGWWTDIKRKVETADRDILALDSVKVRFASGAKLICELADSDKAKVVGLQKYASLPDGYGMVFPFDNETVNFHMGTVPFPIDIIFVGSDNRVTRIVEGAEPGTRERWGMSHVSAVIEVNAGFCVSNNIKVGDKVDVPLEKNAASDSIWVVVDLNLDEGDRDAYTAFIADSADEAMHKFKSHYWGEAVDVPDGFYGDETPPHVYGDYHVYGPYIGEGFGSPDLTQKCECGVDKAGGGIHSSWCPKSKIASIFIRIAASNNWTPAFKNMETGEVVLSPGFHDYERLPQSVQDVLNGPDAPANWFFELPESWMPGFVTLNGNFLTRQQAMKAVGIGKSEHLPGGIEETPMDNERLNKYKVAQLSVKNVETWPGGSRTWYVFNFNDASAAILDAGDKSVTVVDTDMNPIEELNLNDMADPRVIAILNYGKSVAKDNKIPLRASTGSSRTFDVMLAIAKVAQAEFPADPRRDLNPKMDVPSGTQPDDRFKGHDLPDVQFDHQPMDGQNYEMTIGRDQTNDSLGDNTDPTRQGA